MTLAGEYRSLFVVKATDALGFPSAACACQRQRSQLVLFSPGNNCLSPQLRTTISPLNTSQSQSQWHRSRSHSPCNLLKPWAKLCGIATTPALFFFYLHPSLLAEPFNLENDETPRRKSTHRGRFNVLDGRASLPAECEFAAAHGSANARTLACVLHGKT